MIMMLQMISHTTVMPGLYFLIILCNLRVARLLDAYGGDPSTCLDQRVVGWTGVGEVQV